MKNIYTFINGSIQLIYDEIIMNNNFKQYYLKDNIVVSSYEEISRMTIGLEVQQSRGGRICYGFLGANVIPNTKGQGVNVSIAYTKKNSEVYLESSLLDDQYTYKGLPKQYIEYTLSGIKETILEKQNFPKGDIFFEYGANCEVGSSSLFFKMIAEALVDLIFLKNSGIDFNSRNNIEWLKNKFSLR